jgi:hypothetical protein
MFRQVHTILIVTERDNVPTMNFKFMGNECLMLKVVTCVPCMMFTIKKAGLKTRPFL